MDISALFAVITAILAIIVFYAGFRMLTAKRTRAGPTDIELERLLSLQADAGGIEPASQSDFRNMAMTASQATSRAKAYCSRMILRDFSKQHLRNQNFIGAWWRVDHVRPDRWHITQAVNEGPESGMAYDEWVRIGRRHFSERRHVV